MTSKDLVVVKIQAALGLFTKREAEHVFNRVVAAVEETLLENLDVDQFSIKLKAWGNYRSS
jgi:hypothetical protein